MLISCKDGGILGDIGRVDSSIGRGLSPGVFVVAEAVMLIHGSVSDGLSWVRLERSSDPVHDRRLRARPSLRHFIADHLVSPRRWAIFLCGFLDAKGDPVDHPVNDRTISMPITRLNRIANKVLILGRSEKVEILRAVTSSLRPGVFVTAERSARERHGAMTAEKAAGQGKPSQTQPDPCGAQPEGF